MNIEQRVIEAWQTASTDLGIQVTAPFVLTVASHERQYLAHIPHFGGGKGTVVAALPVDAPSCADADAADYRISFVNAQLYATYDRAFFIDTLTEWGFVGPEHLRPPWLSSPIT